MGAARVCTPVGGIVNVVNDPSHSTSSGQAGSGQAHANGFLSDGTSEEAYYKALKRFLDTPKEKIREMSAQAVQAAQPYSMEECAKKYEQLFLTHNS